MSKTYKQDLIRQQRLLDIIIYLIVAAIFCFIVF